MDYKFKKYWHKIQSFSCKFFGVYRKFIPSLRALVMTEAILIFLVTLIFHASVMAILQPYEVKLQSL